VEKGFHCHFLHFYFVLDSSGFSSISWSNFLWGIPRLGGGREGSHSL